MSIFPDLSGADLRLFSSSDLPEARMGSDLWEVAHAPRSVAGFVADHGFHAPNEGELQVPSWREDPSALDGVLAGYRRRDLSEDPAAAQRARLADRDAAEADLFAAVTARSRRQAKLILRIGRAFVPLRELGRGTFLLAWDGARAAARTLGPALAEAGTFDHPDDVYYLTCEELQHGVPANAREVVAARRALRARYQQVELPERWVGTAKPMSSAETGDPDVIDGRGSALGAWKGPSCWCPIPARSTICRRNRYSSAERPTRAGPACSSWSTPR